MMYMTRAEQQSVIREASRVLKPGGFLHIWDATIRRAYPEPFVVDLDIDANGTILHTTYGVVKMDSQDVELFLSMCKEADLTLAGKTISNEQFYLLFRKVG